MKTWVTEVKAKSPLDGNMKCYCGPNIEAETHEDAQLFCESNGLGYCWVLGELIMEIETEEDGITPDWGKVTKYSDEE